MQVQMADSYAQLIELLLNDKVPADQQEELLHKLQYAISMIEDQKR